MYTHRFATTVLGATIAAAMLSAPTVGAQSVNPRCASGNIVAQDGCQKALDLFQYVAPQLGTLVAGGNAILGGGGPLGGFPHVQVALRANIMNSSLPDVSSAPPVATGAEASTFNVKNQFVALPQLDAAIGIFKGIPLAVTNVGGIDLLLSGAYLPSFNGSSVHVHSSGTQLGVGVRLGLLQESIILPGVSVTILRRDLPTVDLSAASGNDSLFVNHLKVKTTSWRLVANKSLLLFGLAAGIGGDRYSSDANLGAYVGSAGLTTDEVAGSQTLTRTNAFVDGTFNILLLKVIGEIGHVSGGNITTYNHFSDDPNAGRWYGSLGARIGL